LKGISFTNTQICTLHKRPGSNHLGQGLKVRVTHSHIDQPKSCKLDPGGRLHALRQVGNPLVAEVEISLPPEVKVFREGGKFRPIAIPKLLAPSAHMTTLAMFERTHFAPGHEASRPGRCFQVVYGQG